MVSMLVLVGLLALASAQLFIPTPEDTTQLPSELYPGASISYKKVRTTAPCTT